MKKDKELAFYEETKDWNFDEYEIKTENLTNWDMYKILNQIATKDSKILDLGTGGGEKVLKSFPEVKEIIGIDYSKEMIKTANINLQKSEKKNIKFIVMDNLKLTFPDEYFDIVIARNTVTNPQEVYRVLKKDGYVIIRGVDKDDCYSLKKVFGSGYDTDDSKPISITDYEGLLDNGFKDVELVPLHQREYFKSKEILTQFLMKVPILNDFNTAKEKHLEEEKIARYIKENTYPEGIRLLRRYYGIIARK